MFFSPKPLKFTSAEHSNLLFPTTLELLKAKDKSTVLHSNIVLINKSSIDTEFYPTYHWSNLPLWIYYWPQKQNVKVSVCFWS